MSAERAKKLAELRVLIGGAATALKLETETLHQEGPKSVPRGMVSEFSGFGKSELLVALLAAKPTVRVAWLESRFTMNPVGFSQRTVDLGTVLFVEAESEMAWAAQQLTASGVFEVVVVGQDEWNRSGLKPKRGFDDKTLRRLQLTAEKTSTGVVLLSEQPTSHFSVRHHWNAERLRKG